MMGAAGASWLGETTNGVDSYEAALAIARRQEDRTEEAGVLRALYEAHVRHGE